MATTWPSAPPQGDDQKADGYMSRAKSIWEKAYGDVVDVDGDGDGDPGDGRRGGGNGGGGEGGVSGGGGQGSGGCGTSEVEGSKPGV